jgi:hypothetical protein
MVPYTTFLEKVAPKSNPTFRKQPLEKVAPKLTHNICVNFDYV